ARFHDGRPVRPADVVASLRRARAAPSGAWALAAVASIADDQDTLVLGLRRPTPPSELAALLAVPALSVTPVGHAPGKSVVGSGPFRVKRVDARKLELEAYADAAAGRPYLDALTLRWFEDADEEARAYEAGEADASIRGAVAFAGHEPKYPTTVDEGQA